MVNIGFYAFLNVSGTGLRVFDASCACDEYRNLEWRYLPYDVTNWEYVWSS